MSMGNALAQKRRKSLGFSNDNLENWRNSDSWQVEILAMWYYNLPNGKLGKTIPS